MVRPLFLKISVLTLSSLSTLFFTFILISQKQAIWITRHLGYWAILATALAFAWLLTGMVKKEWRRNLSWCRHRWGILTLLLCTVFLHLHEPHRFKILYDEYVLLSNSLRMHTEREVSVTGRAHYINGHLHLQQGFVDKRPYFFSFILSLFHDLTGYRPENALILNGIITLLLSTLIYSWCYRIGGERYGILGVLLLTAIPLVAQNATGGGFEIMNICMILIFMHAAWYYLKRDNNEGLSIFILTTVLLAQTRYESILFTLVLATIVLVNWIAKRKVSMNWFSAFSPLLLLPPLVVNQVFLADRGFWQVRDPGGMVFSLDNFIPNLQRAIYYLFNFEDDWTNSFFLSLLGVTSVIFMTVYGLKHMREIFSRPGPHLIFYSTMIAMFVNLFLLMTYHWGQLDDPMASRLSLPLHLFFILSIVFVLKEFMKTRRFPNVIFVSLPLYIIAFIAPVNAQHEITNGYVSSREVDWAMDYIRSNTTENTLIIAESSLPMICHNRASTPIYFLNRHLRQLQFTLNKRIYSQILVLQRFQIDPETLEEVPAGRKLHEGVELELIDEMRMRPHMVSRLSRIIGVEDAALKEEIAVYEKLGEEWEEPTTFESDEAYMTHVLRMLP